MAPELPAQPATVTQTQLREAYALFEARDNDGAEAAFREILQADPENGRVHNDLGTALLRLDRPAEAATSFERAAELHPEVREILRNAGLAHFRATQYAEAIKALAAFASKRPHDQGVLQLLGISHTLTGQDAEAVPILEALVSEGITPPNLMLALSSAHIRLVSSSRSARSPPLSR